MSDYREAWDRCIFYYEEEEERLWQWKIFLLQLEAGAADDKPEYRKLVGQISPMLMPPYNGPNSRKAKVTADIRYAHHTTSSYTTVPMATELDAERIAEKMQHEAFVALILMQRELLRRCSMRRKLKSSNAQRRFVALK